MFLCFAAIKGLYSNQPAHSCKDIRDSGVSKGDGEYWIDPEKSGYPLKVYCDMTTDGGKLRISIQCELVWDFSQIKVDALWINQGNLSCRAQPGFFKWESSCVMFGLKFPRYSLS